VHRYIAGVVVALIGAAAVVFAAQAPWLAAISTFVGMAAGKYFGVGTTDTLRVGLQLLSPERTIEVAVQALQQLPAESTEAATEQLIASLPPSSLVRYSLHPPAGPAAPANGNAGPALRFIGTAESEPPEPFVEASAEPTNPTRPRRPRL
jgi:hypothetical protein